MPDDKLELSVLVDPCTLKTDHYSDNSTFYKLAFVTINEQEQVRNVSSSFGSEPFAGFDSLKFRCWISWSNDRFSADSWEVLYDNLYSVQLHEAERLVKTLKRIRKIEDKMVIRPKTFGQYVAMIAAELGIKRFARVMGRDTGWHNNNNYQFLDVKYLADAVDRSIEDARVAKFEPAEVA